MPSETTTGCFMSQDWKKTFPLTPHPSESAGAQRGSERGEGVPLCSLSQKRPRFPSSQTAMHSSLALASSDLQQDPFWLRRLEEKGSGGAVVFHVHLCHGDPQSTDGMEPGDATAARMRTRWPRKRAAVVTAGNQHGCSSRGPRLIYRVKTHQQRGIFLQK